MNGFDRLSNFLIEFKIFSEIKNDIKTPKPFICVRQEIKDNEKTPKTTKHLIYTSLLFSNKPKFFFSEFEYSKSSRGG